MTDRKVARVQPRTARLEHTNYNFILNLLSKAPAYPIASSYTSSMIVESKFDDYILILGEMFEEFTREPYGYRGRHTPHIPV